MQLFDLSRQQKLIREGVLARIERVLDHGQYILGPEVVELEERLRKETEARHVITCANGTDALVLILRAAGIGPGDAVFVPSFTFVATAEAVVTVGATPIFVDVDEQTYTLCPDDLEKRIDAFHRGVVLPPGTLAALRPKAVIAVDLFGSPSDHERLVPLCKDYGLTLIGDGAQSLGALVQGRSPFAFLEYAATSFFPTKPLGAYGDGGAVFCSNEESAREIRSLALHGRELPTTGTHKSNHALSGYNSRLDTLQAAILLEKLGIFAQELRAKQAIAEFYGARLSGFAPALSVPQVRPGVSSAWALYTIRVKQRGSFIESLKESGVPFAIYYPRGIHEQTAYTNLAYPRGSLPVTERLSEEVVSIPMHAYLTGEEREAIVSAVEKAVATLT